MVHESCDVQESLSLAAGVAFERAGDAATEGGEAGFSGSSAALSPARRLQNGSVHDIACASSRIWSHLNAFVEVADSFSFC
jgi:hypothetical protein